MDNLPMLKIGLMAKTKTHKAGIFLADVDGMRFLHKLSTCASDIKPRHTISTAIPTCITGMPSRSRISLAEHKP